MLRSTEITELLNRPEINVIFMVLQSHCCLVRKDSSKKSLDNFKIREGENDAFAYNVDCMVLVTRGDVLVFTSVSDTAFPL